MFDPKEVNNPLDVNPIVLMGWLHKIVRHARDTRGNDLEILAGILAVAMKGYVKSLGHEQAAMMFYGIGDDLAVNNIDYDEGDEYDSRDTPG